MAEEWITVKEAAELLKRSRRHVVSMIHAGKLKAKRDGRLWLIHSSLSESEEAGVPPKSLPKEAVERLEEEVKYLKTQIEHKDRQLEEKDRQIAKLQEDLSEASQRHDTIVLQLTRQLEQSQRLLEYHQDPWYRRWFKKTKAQQ